MAVGDRDSGHPPLAQAIEQAFDYRGNVTVVKVDGAELEGYLFNRNSEAPDPFIQVFDLSGDGPLTIPYSAIRNIKFTGKDMAAGQSWKAWLERKGEGKGEGSSDKGNA